MVQCNHVNRFRFCRQLNITFARLPPASLQVLLASITLATVVSLESNPSDMNVVLCSFRMSPISQCTHFLG